VAAAEIISGERGMGWQLLRSSVVRGGWSGSC
jgi:hypothetical protein